MYIVTDTEGYQVGKPFSSYMSAFHWKALMGRADWNIVKK